MRDPNSEDRANFHVFESDADRVVRQNLWVRIYLPEPNPRENDKEGDNEKEPERWRLDYDDPQRLRARDFCLRVAYQQSFDPKQTHRGPTRKPMNSLKGIMWKYSELRDCEDADGDEENEENICDR